MKSNLAFKNLKLSETKSFEDLIFQKFKNQKFNLILGLEGSAGLDDLDAGFIAESYLDDQDNNSLILVLLDKALVAERIRLGQIISFKSLDLNLSGQARLFLNQPKDSGNEHETVEATCEILNFEVFGESALGDLKFSQSCLT